MLLSGVNAGGPPYVAPAAYDDFSGSGPLSSALWNEYDGNTVADLTVTQLNGYYNGAHVATGPGNADSTFFDADRGLLHYIEVSGDARFVLRGVTVLQLANGQYQFCGLFAGLPQPGNYEFLVIGHRGTSVVVAEIKTTLSNSSGLTGSG